MFMNDGTDNIMNTRTCLRCLLREMSEADYSFNVGKYIEALGDKARVDDTEYERRLALCKECDLLIAGTCNACGCYVELRAAAKISHCPKKRW